jgi:hypothetical protein
VYPVYSLEAKVVSIFKNNKFHKGIFGKNFLKKEKLNAKKLFLQS